MERPVKRSGRPKIPLDVQVRVLFRDGWLCRWCHRPTIFAPTLRLLQRFVQKAGYTAPIAYFDLHWRRDLSPLLDHLGAVIDHAEAYARGGEHSEGNFVTACNKCNARKNSRRADAYEREQPGKPVKGKFGEPRNWDGLVSLFLVLADDPGITATEKAWKRALLAYVDTLQMKQSNLGMHPTAFGRG
jgi:5-methylcytosine-specific restriction endonuclease McrA